MKAAVQWSEEEEERSGKTRGKSWNQLEREYKRMLFSKGDVRAVI